MKLTVKTAEGIKLPKGKSDCIVFDDDIAGFGLRLREGGSRTWVYQYRIGKKQRRMVLGSAKSVPLILARKNASDLEAKVRLGGDPAMNKEIARLEVDNTFSVLADRFLEARRPSWRTRTYEENKRHLLKDAKSLHPFPITAVAQRNIANLLSDIAKEKGDVTANRVRSSLCAFFGWIVREGVRLPDGNVVSFIGMVYGRSRLATWNGPRSISRRPRCTSGASRMANQRHIRSGAMNCGRSASFAPTRGRTPSLCSPANAARRSRRTPSIGRSSTRAKLGFPVHIHMLRHACGYKLANDGHDTRAIQDYLGHKSIQHTVRYTELSPVRFKGFFAN